MQLSQVPAKFTIPFANGAGGSFINAIPQASQIGINPGRASLTDGFVPLNFTPIASGGIPPFGSDMNGLLNQSTAWDRWFSAGGAVFYDATFQAAVGGYPQYAVVRSLISPDTFWESTTDNNVTNPDAGGAGWIQPAWAKQTGDWAWRPVAATLPGHVVMNGTTMGKASSGAAQASDTLLFVYQHLWNNFSNTQCPVSTGRGANATADFNAGKTIGTLNMQGIGVSGMDVMMGGTATGLLGSVPAVSGSATLAASVLGENLHTLITTELAAHAHANTLNDPTHNHSNTLNDPNHIHSINGSAPGGGPAGVTTGGVAATLTAAATLGFAATNMTITNAFAATNMTITNANAGSGTAHNNFSRKMLGVWFMHI